MFSLLVIVSWSLLLMGLVLSTSDPVPLPSLTTGTPFALIQIRAPLESSLSLSARPKDSSSSSGSHPLELDLHPILAAKPHHFQQ